jgi:UDP-glucose 4-epimerase
MRIFISGIAGFLGSHLADAFLAGGHTVVGIDSLIGGELANVPEGAEYATADCNDFATVAALMRGCELVYHCAATAHEGLSVFAPHVITQNIVTASTGMISAALKNGVRRFVFLSSMARYGAQRIPFTEDMTPQPEDPYGIGKACAEAMLRNLAETHGMEYAIAVPHNIVGPRQKYDDPYRNVASIFANLMLQGRSPVLYGDGTQKRCFSFVGDVVDPLVRMGLSPLAHGEVINLGPDDDLITIRELGQVVADAVGVPFRPAFRPGRPREVKLANCSADKARRLLGYEPKTDLRTGVQQLVDGIRERGPRPFKYHLDLEFTTPATPETWTKKLF